MNKSIPNPSTPAIDLVDVRKSYRRGSSVLQVLQDVRITVARGEFVFLAGPSGSGKSTLLSIIGAILSADQGTVRVLDCDVPKLSVRRLAEFRLNQIGFVFQRFNLIRGLTAVDNICVPMKLAGTANSRARKRALQLLESLGIADKAKSHPAKLSTGECQRVAIARALANDPQLILADEPTASLDANNGRQVVEMLRQLARAQNRTVIIVTHDSRIFPYADRVHWLENGRIVDAESEGVQPETLSVLPADTGLPKNSWESHASAN